MNIDNWWPTNRRLTSHFGEFQVAISQQLVTDPVRVWSLDGVFREGRLLLDQSNPIQYEHAPLRVRCAMLRKHPPVDPVLSCLSCFRKPSVGICQFGSNSPDPGIAWPSARFRPDLWRWFEEDTASIRRLIHSGYMAKQREAMGLDNRGKWRLLSGMTDIFIPHEIRLDQSQNYFKWPSLFQWYFQLLSSNCNWNDWV